jgi:hypothetical protein
MARILTDFFVLVRETRVIRVQIFVICNEL